MVILDPLCLLVTLSGVFVPLMVMFPHGEIPIVSMSLQRSFDPDFHIRIGQVLAPLRQQGVLIIGSGASFHNFDLIFAKDPTIKQEGIIHSHHFDNFLEETILNPILSTSERLERLRQWSTAPSARASHKVGEEEHLLPLHVIAGAGFGTVREGESGVGTAVGARRVGAAAAENELAVSNFEWLE
jgi:aromatic ring-opening dioxygenase catalytic subunit (LigB family)